MLTVTPYAFASTTDLQARLKRSTDYAPSGAEPDMQQRLIDAVNVATHWMEMKTRRKLKARNYKLAASKSGFGSSGNFTCAIIGGVAGLDVGDDVVAAIGIDISTQVASINGSVLTLNNALNSDWGTTQTRAITVGSQPLMLNGDDAENCSGYNRWGGTEIALTERPLVQVFGLYRLDGDGNRTAINTTGARYEYETGRIVLTRDLFPSGQQNIHAEVRAGYVKPDGTTLGHEQYYQLEQIALRVAEIYYVDALQIRGRASDVGAGGLNARLDAAVPADVVDALLPFVRLW